jgi:uncharacterized repeat protein (TIGR02543 family)
MKRKIFFTFVAMACFGLLLACGDGDSDNTGSVVTKYTVTFEKNTTVAGATISEASREVENGKAIGALPTGSSSTHQIIKWTTGAGATTTEVTADTKVTGNMTVYAQWEPNPYEGTATVKFNLNHDDASGASAAPQDRTVTDGKVGALPTPNPTRSEGWGAGMIFDDWWTLASGGTKITATSSVPSENYEVFAHWRFQAGTPAVVGETLVHSAPQMTTNTGDGGIQGSWSGTENNDGSITYSTGAVRYTFPASNVIAAYDLFTVDYVFKGTDMEVITKQGTTNVDYMNMDGDDSTQYPTLSTDGGTLGPFAIKAAGENRGLALQRNRDGPGTVKFTKVTFTKGTRHTITFDASDSESTPPYTGEPIASIQAAEGIVIGPMPTPNARSGYNFAGWVDDDVPYSEGTIMPANDLDLKASWREKLVLQPLVVDFSSPTTLTAIGAGSAVTALEDGTGYTYTYGTAQYEGAWSKFTVTLAEGVSLADYDEIKFTIEANAGDTSYKPFIVLTGKPLPASGALSSPTSASNQYNCTTVASIQFTSGTQTLTFTINKAKASSMIETVEFAIYGHCGASNGTTKFTYSDFQIIQN